VNRTRKSKAPRRGRSSNGGHDSRARLTTLRIGHGYDLHRLVKGRPLFLAGVQIPHGSGLLGHSDGDVVLHAICDALLGAMGIGDIGQQFPDTDERYRGVDSGELARHVVALMRDEGWSVANVDVTICAEEPRLAGHRHAMRCRVADLLGAPITSISIKAKTNEGLDAIGRSEAIAATAVVLLEEVPDARRQA
jgi:2-C-methyl-D-erythritol 2,4-cyclodiphosphate synthase